MDRTLEVIKKANERLESKLNIIYVSDKSNGDKEAEIKKLNTLSQLIEKS